MSLQRGLSKKTKSAQAHDDIELQTRLTLVEWLITLPTAKDGLRDRLVHCALPQQIMGVTK